MLLLYRILHCSHFGAVLHGRFTGSEVEAMCPGLVFTKVSEATDIKISF
jgi:hypothetical protein